MTVYRRCRFCDLNDGCAHKDMLRKALAGLNVTSVLHTCSKFTPVYTPGEAIIYDAVIAGGADEFGLPYEYEFSGHFVKQTGVRALIYIEPNKMDRFGEAEFPARSEGYCKVSFSRIRKDQDGTSIDICDLCGVPSVSCFEYCSDIRCETRQTSQAKD